MTNSFISDVYAVMLVIIAILSFFAVILAIYVLARDHHRKSTPATDTSQANGGKSAADVLKSNTWIVSLGSAVGLGLLFLASFDSFGSIWDQVTLRVFLLLVAWLVAVGFMTWLKTPYRKWIAFVSLVLLLFGTLSTPSDQALANIERTAKSCLTSNGVGSVGLIPELGVKKRVYTNRGPKCEAHVRFIPRTGKDAKLMCVEITVNESYTFTYGLQTCPGRKEPYQGKIETMDFSPIPGYTYPDGTAPPIEAFWRPTS